MTVVRVVLEHHVNCSTKIQGLAQKSLTEHQSMRTMTTRSKSRVNSRCGCDVTSGVWHNFENTQKVNTATESS